MTTADDLIALVRAYNPGTNEKLLRDAYRRHCGRDLYPVPFIDITGEYQG